MADFLHNSVHFLERRLSEVARPIIGVVRERPELVDSEMQSVEARADRVVWKRSELHKITPLLEGVQGRRVDHCATQVRPSGKRPSSLCGRAPPHSPTLVAHPTVLSPLRRPGMMPNPASNQSTVTYGNP